MHGWLLPELEELGLEEVVLELDELELDELELDELELVLGGLGLELELELELELGGATDLQCCPVSYLAPPPLASLGR